jgi:hypothetical protein
MQKFRQPEQQSNTTSRDNSEAEQLREKVKQIGEGADQITKQMQEVSARSGKEKGGASGIKGKKRKAPRKQRRASGINQRQVPPGQGGGQVGGGQEDEFNRVVAMLESIRKTLEHLVFVTPRVVPQELHPSIVQSWHRADAGFKTAKATLQAKDQQVELKPKLETAGFTGEMLDMKETSLNYHMARVEDAILTYNNNVSDT